MSTKKNTDNTKVVDFSSHDEDSAYKGVAFARETRAECNLLTDDQREALTRHAMALIYGGKPPQVASCRP